MSCESNKSLLVPVDFSRNSLEAVNLALFFAKKMGCRLKLLHVVRDATLDSQGGAKVRKKYMQHLEKAAQGLMTEFLSKHNINKKAKSNDCEVEAVMTTGVPLEIIIQEADKGKHGMIVMGASGKTEISKLLLGSVAERVIQLSKIPVVIAKNDSKK